MYVASTAASTEDFIMRTVCKQLGFRYPNLSKQLAKGAKERKNPSTTRARTTGHCGILAHVTWASVVNKFNIQAQLAVHLRGLEVK